MLELYPDLFILSLFQNCVYQRVILQLVNFTVGLTEAGKEE